MSMQINTNVAALNAHRNLSNTQNQLSSSLEKLSSGLRINRAADDAAGLAISEGLRSQVNGMAVAARNAQDGISVIQTTEGALTEVHSILQRMRDLAVQGANDSNNADSRAAIQSEINALGSELERIAGSTNFNGIELFGAGEEGTPGDPAAEPPVAPTPGTPASLTFQVGAGTGSDNQITITLTDLSGIITGLGIAGEGDDANVADAATANAFIDTIDTAITSVSTARADLGAVQNRFESAINSLNVSRENLAAAESRIRDVDMAAEMVNFTRSNILSQAGTAMLAQANQSTSGVLQLLG